jgi:hypothetical protein
MLSWPQRIETAKEKAGLFRGSRGFSDSDVELARDWMTCSCGMLDRRIPRQFDNENSWSCGSPQDIELRTLGLNFYEAVENNEIERAEILYRKVQERAAELIESIESKSRAETSDVPESDALINRAAQDAR